MCRCVGVCRCVQVCVWGHSHTAGTRAPVHAGDGARAAGSSPTWTVAPGAGPRCPPCWRTGPGERSNQTLFTLNRPTAVYGGFK